MIENLLMSYCWATLNLDAELPNELRLNGGGGSCLKSPPPTLNLSDLQILNGEKSEKTVKTVFIAGIRSVVSRQTMRNAGPSICPQKERGLDCRSLGFQISMISDHCHCNSLKSQFSGNRG